MVITGEITPRACDGWLDGERYAPGIWQRLGVLHWPNFSCAEGLVWLNLPPTSECHSSSRQSRILLVLIISIITLYPCRLQRRYLEWTKTEVRSTALGRVAPLQNQR
ncbi:uncharacterized protein BDV14DRAFT_124734 [Aspergillus stella-maris]|uniref:uncharacterized protein n=1 Tax=Aspergillus stella-maris TaxID=1810926 RepID=UPI003CCCD9A5